MKKFQKVFLLLPLLVLTGCAELNSDFDCPLKRKCGLRCQSLAEVNAAIDRGEIGAAEEDFKKRFCVRPPVFHAGNVIPSGEHVSRQPENIMRVWIAPYEDSSGNFHTSSNVYTVTHPGIWVDYLAAPGKGKIACLNN